MKYYEYICSVCMQQIGVGNSEIMLEQMYLEHYFVEHLPSPIIKTTNGKKIKQNRISKLSK